MGGVDGDEASTKRKQRKQGGRWCAHLSLISDSHCADAAFARADSEVRRLNPQFAAIVAATSAGVSVTASDPMIWLKLCNVEVAVWGSRDGGVGMDIVPHWGVWVGGCGCGRVIQVPVCVRV